MKEDAETLILLVGVLQYVEHPDMPGRPWRKIDIEFKRHLEMSDLEKVSDKLRSVWQSVVKRSGESTCSES